MSIVKLAFILVIVPFLLGAQKIINGSAVNKSDPIYWSTVRLIQLNPQYFWVPSCTGVVLSENLILTAAHCVDMSQVDRVRVGYELQPFTHEQQYFEETRIDPVQEFETRKVVKWIIHPEYFNNKIVNDLAIVQIEGIHPAKFEALPMISSEMAKKVEKDQKYYFTIAGYGLFAANPAVESENLRKAKVNGKFIGSVLEINQSEGYGGCFGDSGGPAIINFGSHSYLVGITHGSKNSNVNCEDVGIWVNLGNHLEFIYKSIKRLK